MKPFKAGEKVSWKWAGGVVDGKVVEAFFARVERQIKGKKIVRNGSKEKPAYLVESESGNRALKLHSELTSPAGKARKAKPTFKVEAKLLSGGNPQIAKGEGDGPVQEYIAAIPGWKSEFGARLDKLIGRAVPNVHKAVKWNSPFYGIEGEGWFLSYHCFAKYIKVAFFRGTSLKPVPPGESKQKEVRYLDIYEDEEFDEAQFSAWVKQARKLPGERL